MADDTIAARNALQSIIRTLDAMPRVVAESDIWDTLEHGLRGECSLITDLFDCAPVTHLARINSTSVPAPTSITRGYKVLRMNQQRPDMILGTAENAAKARSIFLRGMLAKRVRAASSQIQYVGFLNHYTDAQELTHPTMPWYYDDLTPRLRDVVQYASGLRSYGLRLSDPTFRRWGNNTPSNHVQFEFSGALARRDFKVLDAALAIVAKDDTRTVPIEAAAALLQRLAEHGSLQECFEARRRRVRPTEVQRIEQSFADTLAKRDGVFRASTSSSAGEIWLRSAVDTLVRTLWDQTYTKVGGRRYGALQKPSTTLMRGAMDVVYATWRATGPYDDAPIKLALNMLKPMLHELLASLPTYEQAYTEHQKASEPKLAA